MLVLSRKPGEGVVIGGEILIRVLGIQGERVRLGIEVPDEVLVLREEVAARLNVCSDLVDVEPQVVEVP